MADPTGPYDEHTGYTRRDSNTHAGYTRRNGNEMSGFTRRDLKNAEEGDGGSKGGRLKSLAANGLLGAEKKGDESSPFEYVGAGKAKWGGARSFLQKNQKKLVAGGLAGIGILPMLALLLFLLGALKIPHFVENMAVWRFAKLTNQYSRSVTNVMGANTALDSLDDTARAEAVKRYGKYRVFDSINRLRPNRVVASLKSADRLKYEYKTTLTGRQKLVAVTIAEGGDYRKKVTYKLPSGRFDRLIHPLRTLDQYKAVSEALNSAVLVHDPKVLPLVRARATKIVIKESGGTLKGLIASRYLGKSDRAAKITIQQDSYRAANDKGGIAGISSDDGKKLAQEVADTTDKVVDDTTKLGESVDKGNGIPDQVLDVVEKGTDPNKISSIKGFIDPIVKFTNPVYDIAMPVCMMYDGSKITAASLDAEQNSVMREAFLMLATADQQKDGSKFSTVMAGALNWKTGEIRDSAVIRRASGKTADTTQSIGGQRTTLGTYGKYTIFDALTDGNGGALNGTADALCPVFTNVWFGLGLGVVNIVGMAISGGTAAAVEKGATEAAKKSIMAGVKKVVAKQISSFTLKKGVRAFAKSGRFAKQFGKDVVKWGIITAGSTFVARMIVMQKAGTMTSGLETKAAFLDNVDNGANHVANEVGRANYRGRPQTNAEMAQNKKVDQATRVSYNQDKSTFERYLSISNPNSLASRMAITTGSLVDKSFFASLLNSFATLLNPLSLSSRVFASANGDAVMAAGNTNTDDYGNVQWEYSVEEQRLMDQDSYASPPENEKVLEDSGKKQDIEDTYGKCYSKSVGQLLADGDIQRNEDGDVLSEGDCSPLQLGPHNPKYGDLVFRWRLTYNYQNTADLLNGIQDPAKNSTVTAGSGTIPTGTVQELATQVLNNPNIKFQIEPAQRQAMENIAATGKSRACGAVNIDPKMLGVMLAMAQKYKIVVGVIVDGHDCDGGFHPKGKSFDLNGVNRLDGSGGTGNFITYAPSELGILSEFFVYASGIISSAGGGGMGQIDCFATAPSPLAPKITYFTGDACNHLHIDVGQR
ncbi:MAG TPA: hypothetical protein VF809_03515 [Candidatus Saccharimonadales bacterium]